ncbi:MAG TPA: CDP-alcohol phosphatidyltransferase family protein, partial [Pirellulales bacterium]
SATATEPRVRSRSTSRRERWAEFSNQCYKPGRRDAGNPLAIYVARPLALLLTAAVAPWGITAHQATLAALVVALAASGAFTLGGPGWFLLGALLWNLWYLVDHVDGQLARLKGQASLDGAALDYLMHHLVNVAVPASIGYGLFAVAGERMWLWVGFVWGLGLLVVGLVNDVRYKAFFQRLKRLDGVLHVEGRNAARSAPDELAASDAEKPDATDRRLVDRASLALAGAARWASFGKRSQRLSARTAKRWVTAAGRLARRMCEVHVLLVGTAGIALANWFWGDPTSPLVKLYALAGALAAASVAVAGVARGLRRGLAEEEFAEWFMPPAGTRLIVRDGTWRVIPHREKSDG